MTRVHNKHSRVYADGVDLSGYARSVGELAWNFPVTPDQAITDGCKNAIAGRAEISAGTINAFLDNDAAGLFVLARACTGTRDIMIPFGAGAAPAAGDPCFAWQFEQTSYKAESGDGFVAITVPIGEASYASTLSYGKPWGVLLHAKGAETAANSSAGIDDFGAASALGGIFVYQVFTSNGTCTLTTQEADTNSDGSFANITGATSGEINATSAPVSGMVALGTTAAIKRYLRWQVALNGASTVTFAAAFIRSTF